jgi:hypothetical protein
MRASARESRREFKISGVIAGAVALCAAFVASPAPLSGLASIAIAVGAVSSAVATTVEQGLSTAPALMAGILIALSLPIVAILGRSIERSRRGRDATRIHRRKRRLADVDVEAQPSSDPHGRAFLEVVGSSGLRFPVHGDMVRIGRDEDNDIRIPNAAVHRYHAAVSREDFGSWRITDLSGLDGNGLRINGQRRSEALLADGDVIDLGPGRLRFCVAGV